MWTYPWDNDTYHTNVILSAVYICTGPSISHVGMISCLPGLNHYLSVASLIADPEGVSLIPAWPHTFVVIEHEVFSMINLLLPLIEGCFQWKCAYEDLVNRLVWACPEKNVVRLTDVKPQTKQKKHDWKLVDWDIKHHNKQTNSQL